MHSHIHFNIFTHYSTALSYMPKHTVCLEKDSYNVLYISVYVLYISAMVQLQCFAPVIASVWVK